MASAARISYFLVLPMLFAGLAYSAGTVSFLAAFGVVTSLVVGILTPHRSWSTTAFLALAVVIAGVITAAAALYRDRLMGQLMDAANLDALTGCLSRRAFQQRLDDEARLARRHRATFSLIVADLDNLKSLNDSGGHHSGDRALRSLAAVLRQAARGTDVVGRLGGDEFAMLLHETDQDAALAVAKRLSEAMHSATGSDLVTASLGVSTWLGADDRPDELLRRADVALYTAKRAGRDRCAIWEPALRGAAGGDAVAGPPPAAIHRRPPGLTGARPRRRGRPLLVEEGRPVGRDERDAHVYVVAVGLLRDHHRQAFTLDPFDQGRTSRSTRSRARR